VVGCRGASPAFQSAVAQANLLVEYLKEVDEHTLDVRFIETHAQSLCEYVYNAKNELQDGTNRQTAISAPRHLSPLSARWSVLIP
jgi:hypothetical protein